MPTTPVSDSNPGASSRARSGATADSSRQKSRLRRGGATGALPFRLGWDGLAVGVIALAAYGLLAPGASGYGDCSELALVLATGGVAHPTGYPLYVLFGHLFVRAIHATGVDWPLAANLWSAVGAAIALALLQIVARELAAGPERRGARWTDALAALLPTLVVAINPIWTGEALLAEVYSWHLAWVMAATLGFVLALRRLGDSDIPGHGALRAGATLWGFVLGLGLAHHLSSVLVSLPLTLILVGRLVRRRVIRPGLVAAAGLSLLVPLSAYGIVAWRAWHPAIVQWPLLAPSLASVLEHVSGAQYSHFAGRFAPSEVHAALLADAGYPVLVVGILALLAGVARGGPSGGERPAYVGLCGAALIVLAAGFRYGVPDPSPYFLPAILLGAAAAAPLLRRTVELLPAGSAIRIGLCAAALLTLGGLVAHWGPGTLLRRREVREVESLARTLWGAVPDRPAIVFWPDDAYTRFRQYQILRNEKPDLFVTTPQLLVNGWPRRQFARRFGFDPMEGLTLPRLTPGQEGEREAIDRFLVSLVRNVTDRSPLPVILMDPTVPNVRQLRPSADPPGPSAP